MPDNKQSEYPKATATEMAENLVVLLAASVLISTTVALASVSLQVSATYIVAGAAGLLKKTRFDNLFVK